MKIRTLIIILGCAFIPLGSHAESSSYSIQVAADELQQRGASVQWDELTLIVPAGAYTTDTRFIIRNQGVYSADTHEAIPRRFKAQSGVYRVKTSLGSQPLKVRVEYGSESEQRKKILFLPDGASEWQVLRTVEQRDGNRVESELPSTSGMVLFVTHRYKQTRPIHATSFQAYSGVPYSDTAAVLDAKSGEFLYREEARKQRPIASITKLMTTLIFLESNPNLDELVAYTNENDRIGASVDVPNGAVLSLKQVLMGTLIPSANNMAVSLSQHSGSPSEALFVERMNARAKELGLGSTYFVEPTGLDSANISTAGNLARLGRLVFATHAPLFAEAADTSMYEYYLANTGERVQLFSTNKFDGRGTYDVTAFKTGYYPGTAERTLILQVQQIGTDYTIILVLLGNPEYNTIFEEAYQLADWAFSNWEFHNY